MPSAPFKIARKRRKPHVDRMIPLINVVFLLLAFFILAGTFRMVDLSDINLPNADIDTASQSEGMRVGILPTGEIRIEGAIFSLTRLEAIVPRLKGKQIFLYADATLAMEKLQPVWKKLEALGAREINLVIRKSGGHQ